MDRPLLIFSVEVLSDRRFGKSRWREVVAALFEVSAVGRPRVELFTCIDKLQADTPFRIILLDECISIRIATVEKSEKKYVKLQMRDGSAASLRADDLAALRLELSRVAFPSQFVPIRRSLPSSDSPTTPTTPTPVMYPGQITDFAVLLINAEGIDKSVLVKDDYALDVLDMIVVKSDGRCLMAWTYTDIEWVALGEHCLGWESRDGQLIEFKCARPAAALEAIRSQMRFSNNFEPSRRRTRNAYTRFYRPEQQPRPDVTLHTRSNGTAREGNSSLERSTSKQSTEPSPRRVTFQSDTASSCHSTSSTSTSPALATMAASHLQPGDTDRSKSSSASTTPNLSPYHPSNRKKRSIKLKVTDFIDHMMPFRSPSTGRRNQFEQTADDEWVRMSTVPPAPNTVGYESLKKFEDELDRQITLNEQVRQLQREHEHSSGVVHFRQSPPTSPTERRMAMADFVAPSRPQSLTNKSDKHFESPDLVSSNGPESGDDGHAVVTRIPLAIASSSMHTDLHTLVSRLAPSSRTSLASASPLQEMMPPPPRSIGILRSSYID